MLISLVSFMQPVSGPTGGQAVCQMPCANHFISEEGCKNNEDKLDSFFVLRQVNKPSAVTVMSRDGSVYHTDKVNEFDSLMEQRVCDIRKDLQTAFAVYDSLKEDDSNKAFRMLKFHSGGQLQAICEGHGTSLWGNFKAWNCDGKSVIQGFAIAGHPMDMIVAEDFPSDIYRSFSFDGDFKHIFVVNDYQVECFKGFKNGKLCGTVIWNVYRHDKKSFEFSANGNITDIEGNKICEEMFVDDLLQSGTYLKGTAYETVVVDGSGIRSIPATLSKSMLLCQNMLLFCPVIISSDFKNGKENGLSKIYILTEGRAIHLLYSVECVDGFQHGLSNEYYCSSNKKAATFTWDKGELLGPCSIYRENGIIKMSGYFSKREMSEGNNTGYLSQMSTFSNTGKKLSDTSIDENGEIVNAIYYNDDGQELSVVKDGNGVRIFYNDLGEVVDRKAMSKGLV